MKMLKKVSKLKPMMSQNQDRPCTRRQACTLAHIDLKTWVWVRTQVTWPLNTVALESDDIAAFPVVLVRNDSWRVLGHCCTAV